MKKNALKSIALLISVGLLVACGTTSTSDSLNYTPLNYTIFTDPPPYYQAIDFSRNLVTENDPSTLVGVYYMTQLDIVMPDNRSDINNSVLAYYFIAQYENRSIDIYVNPEFGDEAAAELEASYYAEVIGRIPLFLRDGIPGSNGISLVYLHQGFEPVVGTSNSLIIYTDRAAELISQGILEEVLIHESVHATLDVELAGSDGWLSAQINDGIPISQLAYDLSNEDAAESLLAYIAVRYKANRLSPSVEETILATIPNRIDYLDFRGFDMNPIVQDLEGAWDSNVEPASFNQSASLFAYYAQWEQQLNF
jgi:hypothetical protein